MEQNNTIQEDEIDLRELFKTIMQNKKKIILITSAITILAVVYALLAPKVYEAKAIVKIGEYKLNNNNNIKTVYVADASELVKELEVLYIELLKNAKNRSAEIKSVSLLKKQKNLFEIIANGNSNKLAVAELKKVLDYTKQKHKKILDDVKELRETQINDIKNQIDLLKEKTLPMLKEKIVRYKKDINIYEQNFKDTQENLQKIKKSNPTLATIQINEQRYLVKILTDMKNSLDSYEIQKDKLEVVKLSDLQKSLKSLQALMKPYNYKNTAVIGKIMTNDYPVKPKKKLIVMVAFVTGLILSIFIVFFLEFLKSFKEDDINTKS